MSFVSCVACVSVQMVSPCWRVFVSPEVGGGVGLGLNEKGGRGR